MAFQRYRQERKLQKLLFPEGIAYYRKRGGFRTGRVNAIFDRIAKLAGNPDGNNKGTNHNLDDPSLVAG